MKYLAILKDSFREAIDTKVFYVMIGLSCLMLLVVASVSYEAIPIDDELRDAGRWSWALRFDFFAKRGLSHAPWPIPGGVRCSSIRGRLPEHDRSSFSRSGLQAIRRYRSDITVKS